MIEIFSNNEASYLICLVLTLIVSPAIFVHYSPSLDLVSSKTNYEIIICLNMTPRSYIHRCIDAKHIIIHNQKLKTSPC